MSSAFDIEIFDVSLVEKKNKDLFLQKETLDFNLSVYKKHFDEYKKENFFELFLFEKKNDNNQLPNVTILNQMKAVSNDYYSQEFIKNIKDLNSKLINLNNKIASIYSELNKILLFLPINLKQYLFIFERYLEGKETFENLMYQIFDKEFNDMYMYDIIKEAFDIRMIQFIVERSPIDWKDFFKAVYDEFVYNNYLSKFINGDSEELKLFLKENEFKKQQIFSIVKKYKQINDTTLLNTMLPISKTSLDANHVIELKSEFIFSRIDIEKKTFEKIKKLKNRYTL